VWGQKEAHDDVREIFLGIFSTLKKGGVPILKKYFWEIFGVKKRGVYI